MNKIIIGAFKCQYLRFPPCLPRSAACASRLFLAAAIMLTSFSGINAAEESFLPALPPRPAPEGFLRFDGENAFVEIRDDESLRIREEISFALWVNVNSWGREGWDHFLGKGDDTFQIRRNNRGDTVRMDLRGTEDVYLESESRIGLGEWYYWGQWHHLAGTYSRDEGVARLYFDGELEAELETDLIIADTDDALQFGANYDGDSYRRFLDGDLDDIRIYDRAISAEEVEQLFNHRYVKLGQGGKVGHWMLNEGEGNMASDSSDYGNHGRIEGAVWKKQGVEPSPEGPVRVILDTDLASDCDDAGAVAVLHALADRGEAEILAMGISARNPHSVLALDAFNTWYGRPDIPIGTVKERGASAGSRYAGEIAEEYPRRHDDWDSAGDAPDVIDIYREALAGEPDIDEQNPGVVMVSIGFMTNFRDLLQSGPCEHSNLPGDELVESKVRLWVCMGGGWGRSEGHREYNVRVDRAASQYAFENWPTPIIFSGYEIGSSIRTGPALADLSDRHIVRRAYELWGALHGRPSWDQASVLYAVRAIDNGPAADYWELSGKGWIEVKDDGSNTWNPDPEGLHRYKIERRPPGIIAAEIDSMMARDPQTGFRIPARHSVSVRRRDTAPAAGASITVSTQLVDEEGFPVGKEGRVVSWSASGGGSFSEEQTLTDASGIATVRFTCSTRPWTEHVVTATDGEDSTMTGTSPKIMTQDPEPVGLIAYYPLSEREGNTAADHSDFGESVDLDISGGVQWLGDSDGVLLDGASSMLQSRGPARKLHNRIGMTGRFSVEVWLRPAAADQAGPARIVSYSDGASERNFTLGHGHHGNPNNDITLRVRTSETNDNGQPQMDGVNALDTEIQHIVATYDGSTLRIYRNGEKIAAQPRAGDFGNWDAAYPLMLGGEAGGQRLWAGNLHRVAIYDRELTESEVQEHFEAMEPVDARPGG